MAKKLRVAHIPQIPCNPFYVDVESVQEAKKIFNILADYDIFQFENRIKPDYSNVTFLEEFYEETQEWISWSDDETGIEDIDEYLRYINGEDEEYND